MKGWIEANMAGKETITRELLEACKALLAKESTLTNGDLYLEFRAVESALEKAERRE